jgi:uncharacterized integral membrane protein
LIVEFISITVLGAYGAKVLYPLELLAKLSSISIFTRLDAIHLIPWILNAVITVTISIYLAVSCLLKVGLNNHRKLIAIVSGIIVLIVAPFISENFNMVQLAICSLPMTAIITIFIAVMPGLILIIDMIKERVLQNEKSA